MRVWDCAERSAREVTVVGGVEVEAVVDVLADGLQLGRVELRYATGENEGDRNGASVGSVERADRTEGSGIAISCEESSPKSASLLAKCVGSINRRQWIS